VPDVASLAKEQLTKLFGAGGLAGIVLSETATLELGQAGTFNPSTGGMTSGNYYNATTGAYTESSPPVVRVLAKSRQEVLTGRGKDTGSMIMMQPLLNVVPHEIVGVELNYQNKALRISSVNILQLGATQLIWELTCQ
tara:strand:- start:714 stop:1127 length:414 start_codon:yes stop_codon:yes gene_type:complete